MPENDWDKIKELVDEALELKPEERSAFLDEVCPGDSGLRREVESLVSSFEKAGDFMKSPAFDDATVEMTGLTEGSMLGRYEIVRRLGEGGMGTVHLAKDTSLGRLVAVKVLNKRFERREENVRRFIREAKAASALNHPNILTIFEIGEFDGSQYIVSEYIEGKTLRELLNTKRIEIPRIIDIAIQIASALEAAHKARIIHRDIKPENIILREDGYVKVLDFGLAKLLPEQLESGIEPRTAAQNTTSPGLILGTVSYMSPEQAKGKKVDGGTDIFSLGIVFYEMLTAKQPFSGDSIPETLRNLLDREPEPICTYVSDAPDELQPIVKRMLAKVPDERYSSAGELLSDLRMLPRSGDDLLHRFQPSGEAITRNARTRVMGAAQTGENIALTGEGLTIRWITPGRLRLLAAAAILLTVLLGGGAWLRNRWNVNWAADQISQVKELAMSGKRFEAYDLALEVQKYVPNDPDLATVMPSISDNITIITEPVGASVYLKRYQLDQNGGSPERQLIGTTPINELQVPRGPQIVYIEKEGYAPIERTILGRVAVFANSLEFNSPPIKISQRLIEAGSVPEKMVFVPGGEYRLLSSQRPTDEKVRLDDYFIDKYEVSNRDFKEFVSGGGYARQEYWKVPIVKDGRALSWSDAMLLFRDRTSLPGPREWSNQDFPQGRADHPVTGITWYEAAAYAEFSGKKLPTIFQWEKASNSRDAYPLQAQFMPWGAFSVGDPLKNRANFDKAGTLSVDSGEFGMGPFGAFNMAGNVSEWTLNDGSDGYYATGGAWGDPPYTFSYFGVYPGLFESSKRGFRCVRLAAPEQALGDQGGAKIQQVHDAPDFQRTTDAQFRELAQPYYYTKTPLDAAVVEAIETVDWRREKITFNGAGGERAIAYLYLPHNAARPLQVIQWISGSHVDSGTFPLQLDTEAWLGPAIKAGRAVLAVVVKGNSERPWPEGFESPLSRTAEYRDLLVNRYTDHRRGLDYLETRDDIDMSRAAFAGLSSGASQGLVLPALETRYRGVFLIAGGVKSENMNNHPSVNPINFAPHIRAPKYVLNGRFDEAFPIKSGIEPMMKLFSAPKQLELFDGPHAPPMEILVPAMNKFFDQTLGPVRRQ
jgi:eukaryotic-like serine/threonine-protein kinase